VVYQQEDFENLKIEIGHHMDVVDNKNDSNNTVFSSTSSSFFDTAGSLKKHVVDTRNFMKLVLKTRLPWTKRHVYLCKRILKCLNKKGFELIDKKTNCFFKVPDSNPRIKEDVVFSNPLFYFELWELHFSFSFAS
jgi:hypothetical protein